MLVLKKLFISVFKYAYNYNHMLILIKSEKKYANSVQFIFFINFCKYYKRDNNYNN